MSETPQIREELFPAYVAGGAEKFMDRTDTVGMFADIIADRNATSAAASDIWNKYAQPGFEAQTESIRTDASTEIREAQQRGLILDGFLPEGETELTDPSAVDYKVHDKGVGIIVPRQRGSSE